jgi:hypothetical protein
MNLTVEIPGDLAGQLSAIDYSIEDLHREVDSLKRLGL